MTHQTPYAAPPGPWAAGGFDVQGHRGARGLVPENTVPSFLAAVAAGCSGVELDVRLTADRHVVVWHDARVQADKCVFTGPDLTGARIDELTVEQLRTVDVGRRTLAAYPRQAPAPGAKIVTLAELFDAVLPVAPHLWWTIEVKVDPTDPREVATRPALVEAVLASVHRAGVAGRCFVHSFDWSVLELAARLDPGVPRSALAVVGATFAPASPWLGPVDFRAHDGDLAAAARAAGASVVSPHFHTCTTEFVAGAHRLGLAVLPWTVNAPGDLRRMRAAGVDGVVTDDPDVAVALLR